MNFTHYDLGNINKGKVVEVHLSGNAANVYLMDSVNFAKYKKALSFQAIGGLVKSTPVKLQTANAGIWHVVVDLPKGVGTVKTSYRILNASSGAASDKLQIFKPSEGQKRALSATATKQTAAKSASTPKPSPTGNIICRKCGKEIGGGKFCPDCGTALDKRCPGCGRISENSSKFCLECGTSLS